MAQDEFTLKTFHLTVPLVRGGQAVSAIVADEAQGELARSVQDAVRAASGVELPIIPPEQAGRDAWREGRSLILLGRLGSNAAVDELYINHYLCADARYPGEGGYELRTIHDPWGSGGAAIFLGGSDDAGVALAIERFAELLPEGGEIVLAHTVRAAGPAVPQPLTEASIAAIREQIAASNFRAVGERASSAALNYHRSGDANQAIIAKEALYRLGEIVETMDVVDDSRGSVYLPLVFDLVEESVEWSDADREQLSRNLYVFSTKLRELIADTEPTPIPHGNNWNVQTAWEATRYFSKYYGIDINGRAERNMDTYFGSNMTWKSREDCPGYGSMTVIDNLHYVLKKPDFAAYFDSGIARQMADYQMTVTDNRGSLAGFGDYSAINGNGHFVDPMSVLAWYYDDGRYIWMRDKMYEKPSGAEFLGQAFLIDGIEPVEPTDLLGVHVLPLEDWIYDNRDLALNTGVPSTDALLAQGEAPPHEDCFDKISYRDSFDPSSEYLLLGGQSHGYHSHPDGNAIISFTDQDRLWLFDSGYFVPDTVEHNTMMIVRDGLFQPVPRLPALEAMGDLPSAGMTRTTLRGYNGADWSRNIIWAKGKYTLVLDEVTAREPGDYGLQCVWRVIGEPEQSADRVLVRQTGARFALVSDGAPTWEQRGVTPESAARRSLLQSQNAELGAGETISFANAFCCPTGEADFPVDVVRVLDGVVLVSGPDGVAYAGVGPAHPQGLPQVEARLFHITDTRISLADATSAEIGDIEVRPEALADVEIDLAAGRAVIASEAPVVLEISEALARTMEVVSAAQLAVRDGRVALTLAPGRHELRFAADEGAAGADSFRGLYDVLARRKAEMLAQRAGGGEDAGEALFAHEPAREETRTFFADIETGEELPDLARQGAASVWTEAQAGASPRNAVDGNLETYSAVGSSAPHVTDLPKDIGVEWGQPVTVGQAWFYHHSAAYAPAEDGHDIQAWIGDEWVSLDDTVVKSDDGATWVHSFEPVETTRLRLFVTGFAQMRTAVREMKMFAAQAEPREETRALPKPVRAMKAADITSDGRAEIVACAGGNLVALDAAGERLWSAPIGESYGKCLDIYDLDADGRPEVIVGGQDQKVYCFDADGNERWVVDCPADPYTAEIEPQRGTIDVLAAGDINADGLGEIVFGASNWLAYALNHRGELLWKAINWAHPPLDIALQDVTDDGRLEALIATRYNDANLFDADGRQIDSISAGYHGIPMSVAAADLDGDGTVELITGSRVGNLHVKPFKGTPWELSMGSQVTDVATADLAGDGTQRVLACSASHYVICADASGSVIWRANVGGAARQMAIGDINGDGAPEVVVAVAGDAPAVLRATGELLGRLGPADAELIALADVNGDGRVELLCARDGLIGAWR